MKTLSSIKQEQQNKVNELITNTNVFFAFSNEQFKEGIGKNPLAEGDKYVNMGMGGFIPKSNVDKYIKGMEEISKWFKDETKNIKLRKKLIAYELANHEAYYTGEIDATLEALGNDYSVSEVLAVYNTERKKYKN